MISFSTLSLLEQPQDSSLGFLYCLLQADPDCPQIPPAPEKAMQSPSMAAILGRSSHKKTPVRFLLDNIATLTNISTSSTDHNRHPFPPPNFFQEYGLLKTGPKNSPMSRSHRQKFSANILWD